MGWSTDDTARPVTPDISPVVWRTEARVQALESRMQRHEDDMRDQLGNMAGKIDKLDNKIDALQEMLAKWAGERSNSSHIGKIALAIFAGVASWFHFDFTHFFRSGGS